MMERSTFLSFGTTTKRQGKKVADGTHMKMLSTHLCKESEDGTCYMRKRQMYPQNQCFF